MTIEALEKAKIIQQQIISEERSLESIRRLRKFRNPKSFMAKIYFRILHFHTGVEEICICLSDQDLDYILACKQAHIVDLRKELENIT